MTAGTTGLPPADSIELFRALVRTMNAHPELYEPLGWCDLDLAVVMRRRSGDAFRVGLHFHDHGCEEPRELAAGEEVDADCWLEGDLDIWEAILADTVANGRSTGELTINSLVLLGDRLGVRGADPARVDRFFRYAETMQRFIDGAALALPVPA